MQLDYVARSQHRIANFCTRTEPTSPMLRLAYYCRARAKLLMWGEERAGMD